MSKKIVENEKVFSPFATDLEAILKNRISSKLIIKIYGKYGINVERFFSNVENVGIYECPLTKYRFYYPPSVIGDDIFYEELQAMENGYYIEERSEYEIALNKLEKGDKVLEVGCGDGRFLEKLKQKNIEAVGLEFNNSAVKKCRSKGLNVQKESIETFALRNPGKFDAVVLFQVLEHIYDVSTFIQGLLACLKKEGQLIIGVPDNSPYHKNFRIHLTLNLPPHHMGLWNAESFKNLEKVFDVSLISTEYDDTYSSFPSYVYFFGDLLLTRYETIYNNDLLRNLFIVLLTPYTLPVALKMKFASELKPHSIIATFTKN
jgi:2-polyprenyl-3-methyl-5-hydroxy-6-metoxy-1,4-benzoquinol methylase